MIWQPTLPDPNGSHLKIESWKTTTYSYCCPWDVYEQEGVEKLMFFV